MTMPLRVLMLEDQPECAEMVAAKLRQAGFAPDWTRVQNETEFLAHLDDPGLDLILADYNLPHFDALRALSRVQERNLNIPFIVITGFFEEEALECLKRGATDYLLKDRLGRLQQAVTHALETRRLQEEKRQIEL
ncbi:MAG: response regulator, partial [Candidatus Solibacter usitatus]|nr:response regulator [Candidatus Solibacter usitatus]